MEFLMIVLTLLISTWNAYVSGKQWPLAKLAGGFIKLTTIAGAVMSAIGFTMVYAMVIMYGYLVIHGPNPHVVAAFNALFPAFIIVPLVMAAIIITLESWKAVFASGQSGASRVINLMAAGWNSYATIRDISEMPGILGRVSNFIKSDDRDSDSTGVVLGLILLATMSGVVTTWMIFRAAAQRSAEALNVTYQNARG